MQGTQWLLAGCYEIFLFCCRVLHYLTAFADHLEGGGGEGEEGGEVGKRGMVKEEQREYIATNDTEQKVFVTR